MVKNIVKNYNKDNPIRRDVMLEGMDTVYF